LIGKAAPPLITFFTLEMSYLSNDPSRSATPKAGNKPSELTFRGVTY